MEHADDVCPGKDHTKFEGDLVGFGVLGEFAAVGSGSCFSPQQVAPLLLNSGHFIVHPPRASTHFGGCRDKEAPAWEDSPLDIGEIALTKGQQTLRSRLGA